MRAPNVRSGMSVAAGRVQPGQPPRCERQSDAAIHSRSPRERPARQQQRIQRTVRSRRPPRSAIAIRPAVPARPAAVARGRRSPGQIGWPAKPDRRCWTARRLFAVRVAAGPGRPHVPIFGGRRFREFDRTRFDPPGGQRQRQSQQRPNALIIRTRRGGSGGVAFLRTSASSRAPPSGTPPGIDGTTHIFLPGEARRIPSAPVRRARMSVRRRATSYPGNPR